MGRNSAGNRAPHNVVRLNRLSSDSAWRRRRPGRRAAPRSVCAEAATQNGHGRHSDGPATVRLGLAARDLELDVMEKSRKEVVLLVDVVLIVVLVYVTNPFNADAIRGSC